jgi:spore maturation protein CgeB
MKIALVLYELSLNSYDHGIVYGEEIVAIGMRKAFLKLENVEVCDLLTINIMRYKESKGEKLDYDLAIHFNTSTLMIEGAMNVLFFQQFYEWEKHNILEYEKKFDFIITPSVVMANNLDKVIYFPLAVDAEYYSPQPISDKYSCDVTFVGNRKMRTLGIYNKYLLPATNYDLSIYGAEWNEEGFERYLPFWKGMLPYDDAAKLYSSSKISLCIHGNWYIDQFQLVTDRAFHAIACGGFVISDQFPEIMNLLPENKGIVYTKGYDNSQELIEYYLNSDTERKKISKKGRIWVLENHTWDIRVEYLLGKIKMNNR